jgi:AcrR family transcriptional regulator
VFVTNDVRGYDGGMPRTSAPVSRRDRPAKPPLTRELVVDTGLAVLDRDGLDALTMRRVAQELDTGAASLYVYVANREDLMAAMLERALGTVSEPPPDGPWQQRLTAVLEATAEAMSRHSGLALVALGEIPTGHNALRIFDMMIGVLGESGLEARAIAWAVDLLYLHATVEAAEHRAYVDKGASENEMVAAARERFAALTEQEFPHLVGLRGLLLSGGGGEREAWFRKVLITGILGTALP